MNSEQNLHESLNRVCHDTLVEMLGLDLEMEGEKIDLEENNLSFGGIVHILGDWMGSITFHCSDKLGRIFTDQIFELHGSDSRQEQRDEVAREIANMLGGNLKSVLGSSCILSVPKTLAQVQLLEGIVPETELVAEQSFRCCNELLTVRVHQSELSIPC